MGINNRYLDKFNQAYKDIPKTITPISFLEDSQYYHCREWREVIQRFVPDVVQNAYLISNYGEVYTNLKSPNYPNGGIMKHSINEKGYHQINLKSINKTKICVKIARLVMLHFKFIPYCQYLEVDHIDGNKDNNKLWNLDWVTPQENVHRAILNEQRSLSCTSKNGTLLTDNQAYELYDKTVSGGYSLEYLSKEYNVSIDYIISLYNGSIRPYIANKYSHGKHFKF